MESSKNVLIINDMTGYGKVALAAMLPVLSSLGHSVYNLPTALVSNTLDYGKFTILDTTEYMKKAIQVWKELGFTFDCITTGFLASAAQVGIIRDFIASQRKEGLLVMTDPIMGDDGKLYNGVSEETVENMRRLLGVADVIVPNLTEAEFLTERCKGQKMLNREEARGILDALRELGPKSVIITSGVEAESGNHVVWGYDHKSENYFTLPYRFIRVHFPGTGDLFSAVLVGELLAGSDLCHSVKRAMDVLEQLILLEQDEIEKNKGIRIEKFLSVLKGS
ncbi:MAG: pyridoxamine kinase [Lawsonibacter sp.]